jgi:coenzyme F420 biosynthesis associated uncharacterized protein
MARRRSNSSMIDWDFAVSTASRLVSPGPVMHRDEIEVVVDQLRVGARVSEGYVRDFTGLHARSATAPVLVVDRPGWVQANADGMSTIMNPLVDKLTARKQPSMAARMVGAKVTGAEAGALLAFLSTKVLGQFDPFWDGEPGTTGRLLLVAPNITAAHQQMDVDAHDFRLWVCLHEETHRVQFTAVPWLRDHMLAEMNAFVTATEVDPEQLRAMLGDAFSRVAELVRGDSSGGLVDLLTGPEQRAVIERLTAVMSLLEGHADVVMDGVGPEVVPTVATIRKKFTQRRKGASPLDVLLRRLLGLEAKMKQYADGAVFVNAVVDKVGMDDFNAVWTSPDTLPTAAEIADPAAWVARVHG